MELFGPGTPLPVIDQCFFAYSTSLVAKTAAILNNHEDEKTYTDLLQKIKEVFVANFRDSLNTQTACVLALQFDMLPEQLRTKTVNKLVSLIGQNNNHLATGFLGTPFLLHVLTRYGYNELAYAILNQTTAPSWLYPVTKGATTIWEKWDAIKPDGTFDTCSLNHYAYGAVGDWLYQNTAGIQSAAPGYKKIIIKPIIGGELTWVNASYRSASGRIVSNWKIKDNQITMHVEIPHGTTATIFVPGKKPKTVTAGTHDFKAQL